MMEKEFQSDPTIIQEALKAVPRFMESIEAAMMKPLQFAFRDWFQANSPPLEQVPSFKAVESAFIGIVAQQVKAKAELQQVMKSVAGPGGNVDKLSTEYWQHFEDMVLTKCKITWWEAAGKGRPDVLAKILSNKVVLMAVMEGITSQEMLASIIAEETLKFFIELKKLAPKK
ncbi:MAG: hypothetical protein GYA24_11350 [Candidatus Lokiarchaeota archaeon]|nr:hypothetical protein [Candidatus Lokiarchaeota archaeon]